MKMNVSGKSIEEVAGLVDELIYGCRANQDSFRVERWGSKAYLGWD